MPSNMTTPNFTEGKCRPESDKEDRFHKAFLRKLFPEHFRQEVKQLACIAWPITLSSLFTFLCTPIALIFCGHLGKRELDAAALATSMINATGVFVCAGLSLACDTVFSQSFGGSNLKMLGVQFQKSLIIIFLACCICWTVHLNAEPILIMLQQDPIISRLAADYMLFFAPGLLCNFVFQVSVKFLQNQNIVKPPVVLGLLGNLFNVLAHYVLVFACDLRTRGSAIAMAVSWFITSLGTLCYIKRCGVLEYTWGGWSLMALEDWGYFLTLAFGGLVMTILELGTIESGIFLNGVLGLVQQGAMSISLQIDWCLYVITLGLGIACSIRVGQNLGAGNTEGAKTSFRVALVILFCLNSASTGVLLALKDVAGYLFTNDRDVVQLVSQILPTFAVVQSSDVITGICGGALRGCGKQWKGGVLNFVGYGFVAVPCIVLLMFYTDMEALGFWWGIVCGMVPISIIYIIIMLRTDWEMEAFEASDRYKQDGNLHIPKLDTSDDHPMSKNSSEKSLLLKDKSSRDSTERYLIAKRAAACITILSILLAGVFVRLFVYKM